MLKVLIDKEIKSILLSPKFVATFSICTVLIVLSVFTGILEYRTAVEQYRTATDLTNQEMREASSWGQVQNRIFRNPNPMQIFASGVHYDIGRMSSVNTFRQIKLQNSPYSDDPIYAVFRFLDLTFIFQVVLSLLAILFTYDAVSGEREQGTLQLTFANALPRGQYLFAKFVGSWLGLIIPLLLPILLSVLLVMVYGIPMTGDDWGRLVLFFMASILYFTFFVAFALLVSTLTRQSSVSFLFLLVAWVLLVLIIPRGSTMMAGQMIPVPSVSEIESQRDGYAVEVWDEFSETLSERWQERSALTEGMTEEERQAYRDDHEWEWMQEDDELRKGIDGKISEFGRKLEENLRNQKNRQEQLAFTLSRFSPASSYQLAAMHLAGTDIDLKTRYEDALHTYRESFTTFIEEKRSESGGGGIRIEMGSDGFSVKRAQEESELDLSELPEFLPPTPTFTDTARRTPVDLGLLALYSLLAFAGAALAFNRYDVR